MNQQLLEELHKEYDQEELAKYYELDVYSRVVSIRNWCDYEDYFIFDEMKTVSELEELYLFIQFGVGVEYMSGVFDMVADEWAENKTDTADLCKKFNNAFGRTVFSV